jgi:hypothetical protein
MKYDKQISESLGAEVCFADDSDSKDFLYALEHPEEQIELQRKLANVYKKIGEKGQVH